MEINSITEENYLKAIYQLSERDTDTISTNAIAAVLNTSAASVTDMLKRLTGKELTVYEPYKGARLSEKGAAIALRLVRKHRLWETFLVDKLQFSWDEVHEIAEELEHIKSDELINRLEAFLGFPRFDPHGDPIPDKNGEMESRKPFFVSNLQKGQKGVIVGVDEHSTQFLQFLEMLGLTLGTKVEVTERHEFDSSLRLRLNDAGFQVVSLKVCQNLFIKPLQ